MLPDDLIKKILWINIHSDIRKPRNHGPAEYWEEDMPRYGTLYRKGLKDLLY